MLNLINKSIKVVNQQGLRVFLIKLINKLKNIRSNSYENWILINEPTSKQLSKQLSLTENFRTKPHITIFIFGTDQEDLKLTYDSLTFQTYKNFEIQSIEASENQESFFTNFKNGWGTFIFAGDRFSSFTLFEADRFINDNPNTEVFYADDDSFGSKNRFKPFFKPDWSPETLEAFNYIGNPLFFNLKFIAENNISLNNLDQASLYDFTLKMTDASAHVGHIKKILYHNNSVKKLNKNRIDENAVKLALQKHAKRHGLRAQVTKTSKEGVFKTSFQISRTLKVAIIIPTKDKVSYLRRCVESIISKTTYKNYEIIIVDNQSIEIKTFDYFNEVKKSPKIKVFSYDFPFSFSGVCNFGATKTDADLLLFLNNDTEVINPEWLEEMVGVIQKKEVGVVGAKLLYPNKTIQHAGVSISEKEFAGHVFSFESHNASGYFFRLLTPQNYVAVTGACLMIKSDLFKQIGGFSKLLPIAFNDIDLCLEVFKIGLRIVWTPYALLYHHESLTRGLDISPEKANRLKEEKEYCKRKWRDLLAKGDPYFNQNINLNLDK